MAPDTPQEPLYGFFDFKPEGPPEVFVPRQGDNWFKIFIQAVEAGRPPLKAIKQFIENRRMTKEGEN